MNRNPDYFFTGDIRTQLAGFKAHLQESGDGENTIRQKVNYAGYFLAWLDREHLTTDQVGYTKCSALSITAVWRIRASG